MNASEVNCMDFFNKDGSVFEAECELIISSLFVLYSGGARTKFESGRRPRLGARAASGKPAWTNSSAVCPDKG